MAKQSGQRSGVAMSEQERVAAVAVLTDHMEELAEAKRDGDDDLWDDIANDGVEVVVGGARWELCSPRTPGRRHGRPRTQRSGQPPSVREIWSARLGRRPCLRRRSSGDSRRSSSTSSTTTDRREQARHGCIGAGCYTVMTIFPREWPSSR